MRQSYGNTQSEKNIGHEWRIPVLYSFVLSAFFQLWVGVLFRIMICTEKEFLTKKNHRKLMFSVILELLTRFELVTSSLPRMRSTY